MARYVCRRLSALDIDSSSSSSASSSSSRIEDYDDDDDDGDIVIAIDSTGIKVTNRGQWLRDKYNIRKKEGKKERLPKDPYCC